MVRPRGCVIESKFVLCGCVGVNHTIMREINISAGVREQLLDETGHGCANPSCRITLPDNAWHADYVFQDDVPDTVNLIALCHTCHERLHRRDISRPMLQAWKIHLLARAGLGDGRQDLRIAALRNYAGLAPFFPEGYYDYPTRAGRIYLDIRESHMMFARALDLYETDKMDVVTRFLKPGMTFVDAGANKGDFTLLASGLVDPGGRVFSFEPEPENVDWLRRSMELNGHRNVRIFDIALGDNGEPASLYLGEKSGWHTLIPPGGGSGVQKTIQVRKRRLDDVLAESGDPRVHMVKIDVEGGEMQVLNGARKTLSSAADMVLLLDIHPHQGVDPAEVIGFLHRHGFSPRSMRPPHETIASPSRDLREILALRGDMI